MVRVKLHDPNVHVQIIVALISIAELAASSGWSSLKDSRIRAFQSMHKSI